MKTSSVKPDGGPPPATATRAAPRRLFRIRRDRPKTNWRQFIAVNLVSLLVHALILGACAFIVLDRETVEEIFTSLVINPEPDQEAIVLKSPIHPEELSDSTIDTVISTNVADLVNQKTDAADLNLNDLEPSIAPDDNNVAGLNIKIGDDFSGRSAAAKAALVRKFGGNAASEAAVASGLKWLADRQLPDGSWTFEHTVCKVCRGGGCSQAGTLKECYNGATAMALLAYLGGGHTHQKGDYQRVVKRGLDSLLRYGQYTEEGLDLRGNESGKMYVQGLATIVLCETASLTKDSRYSKAASQAVMFIANAQDPNGGGWRYDPRQQGDTSVVGWQVMALKGAQNAKLKIPSGVLKRAEKFLDSVQGENGAVYGYMTAPKSLAEAPPSTTAIALLCRMYLGWNQKTPALERGVQYLAQVRPSPNNIYYNYYATQVMHHWGGEEWAQWNEVMRDHLVNSQLKEGVEAGSWDVTDPHGGGVGGRLYQTCLSVMTLEVYYRHLPIYQRERLKVEF